MDASRYESDINLSEPNAHTFMIELTGHNKRVLEVGCSTGYMSKVLSERGCRVLGIEIDPSAAAKAKEHCDDVVVGDVEALDLASTLGTKRFDVVVFGDVLEHLKDPLAVLRKVRPLLLPGGYVVASIPNVAHGAIRLALLQGRFEYRSKGLLDETHLKFFTRGSVEMLFRESGFVLVEMRRTQLGLFDSEIPVDGKDFPPEVITMVEKDPEAITYQFVVKAVIDDGLHAVQELHEREEIQRAQIFELHKEIESMQRHARDQIKQRDETVARLTDRERELRNQVSESNERLSVVEPALSGLEERWARLESRRLVRLYRRFQRLIRPGKRE